jgi:hypothetical protein
VRFRNVLNIDITQDTAAEQADKLCHRGAGELRVSTKGTHGNSYSVAPRMQ